MPRTPRTMTAVGVLLIVLSTTACGSTGSSTEDTPESTSTSAQVPTEPTDVPDPEDTPTDVSAPAGTPSPSASDEGESGGKNDESSTSSGTAPSGLPQPEAGEPLTLSDFFQPDGNWSENSYSVVDRESVKGVGSDVSSCQEDSTDTELELRLQNKFDQLNFSVGQSNASERSDQRVVVRVLGDNEQLDVSRVPFNEVQQFQVDVQDTNAVRILFHLDEEVEQCYGGSAQVVVHDISVS